MKYPELNIKWGHKYELFTKSMFDELSWVDLYSSKNNITCPLGVTFKVH